MNVQYTRAPCSYHAPACRYRICRAGEPGTQCRCRRERHAQLPRQRNVRPGALVPQPQRSRACGFHMLCGVRSMNSLRPKAQIKLAAWMTASTELYCMTSRLLRGTPSHQQLCSHTQTQLHADSGADTRNCRVARVLVLHVRAAGCARGWGALRCIFQPVLGPLADFAVQPASSPLSWQHARAQGARLPGADAISR